MSIDNIENFAASGSLLRDKRHKTFKIIVIGSSNVGKTCLTFRFCEGHFPKSPEATIGVDFREKRIKLSGEEIVLQLWDTAGQERFRRSMVQHYYRNVDAVVFVYDITRYSSFNCLPLWIEECNNHNLSPNIPRILVGNKCDCKGDVQVPSNLAQRFGDQHNMPCFETSAKDDSDCDHVNSIFVTLAHKLVASKPMMPRDITNFPPEDVFRLNSADMDIEKESLSDESYCYC